MRWRRICNKLQRFWWIRIWSILVLNKICWTFSTDASYSWIRISKILVRQVSELVQWQKIFDGGHRTGVCQIKIVIKDLVDAPINMCHDTNAPRRICVNVVSSRVLIGVSIEYSCIANESIQVSNVLIKWTLRGVYEAPLTSSGLLYIFIDSLWTRVQEVSELLINGEYFRSSWVWLMKF